MDKDYEIKLFANAKEWRQWLMQNHAAVDGVWLQFYKKSSGLISLTYAGALDEALCFGWIDGQAKSIDEQSYLQKFTPRRKRSMWSKRNIEYVERLTAAGLMMPAGVAEVDRAKTDGRWQAAYDKPSQIEAPDYLLAELHKNTRAKAVFESLNKTNRYAILWRLQTVKTDKGRRQRLAKIMDMLDKGQTFH